MGKKTILLLLTILCLLTTVSCSNRSMVTITMEDIDNIGLELIERKEETAGMRYTLRLHNGSKHTIVQNNVFLSYPLKMKNGTKENPFKMEARNNKLNIKPEEEVLLTVLAPKEMVEGHPGMDITKPFIEIKGYLKQVSEENQFHIGGED
ncbi:hypothetical protein [Paenibacillus macerans]|uniref:hypothetical protein n=1 Tax=Paenibacillus macerans TaxID=44252 RepID=UPI003D3188FF